jgi:hypothetical protein
MWQIAALYLWFKNEWLFWGVYDRETNASQLQSDLDDAESCHIKYRLELH